NNGRNLSNSIVLDSENNQIKGNSIYPAETGPVSYKINWAQDYRVLFIINRHNSLFMRVRAMNPKRQAVSR
ncbi:12908_t:CDS:1, partial [Rhizophagus irregularis]